MKSIHHIHWLAAVGLICIVLLNSCTKEDEALVDETVGLKAYFESESGTPVANNLIACAAGTPEGWSGNVNSPVSIFYLPRSGAYEIAYWESNEVEIDPLDFNAYVRKALPQQLVWNGKLRRFENTPFEGERWGIVTYKIGVTIYYSDPIRLKVNTKPTQIAPELLAVAENGIAPAFSWSDGDVAENVIYFQAIATTQNQFVSGTYTYDLNWEFYNLDNVVLNVHDVNPVPMLQPNSDYSFTLMGVSEDNWVNLFAQQNFSTSE